MTEPELPGRRDPVGPDELLAAYALDAVSDEEREVVERHLAASPEARAEVDAYREAAAGLADEAAPVAPPTSLKASILARLDDAPQVAGPRVGGPQVGAAGADRDDVASADAAPAESAPAASAPVESLLPQPATSLAPVAPAPAATPAEAMAPVGAGPAERAARRRWFQRPGAILASAAAAVLLIAGAVVGLNWTGPAGWGAQRQVETIAAADDAQTTTVEAAGGGEVTLVWSEQLGRSAIRAERLPEVGDDRTYELWYIDASGEELDATPAGLFDPDGGAAYVVLEGEFEPGLLVGITVEPAGGSEAPTSDPIVAFET
ncbi:MULTISPECIES: anti-sigma factor domain-containing protein [unclassified Agromyces]|uniref:anti-sigma factor domain-containing protein n=1 Tax=unclassified Agromyces TaxID=2639701 RepID=UPI0030145137